MKTVILYVKSLVHDFIGGASPALVLKLNYDLLIYWYILSDVCSVYTWQFKVIATQVKLFMRIAASMSLNDNF